MLLGLGMFLGVLLSFGISCIIAQLGEEAGIQGDKSEKIGALERTGLIKTFHGNERNVTCWVWTIGSARGGISCIPDHMLAP